MLYYRKRRNKMKNKLKIFFITAFILLLIPFSLTKTNLTTSSASTISVSYPPTQSADAQYLDFFNNTQIGGTIITAFRSKYYSVVFCDEQSTYLANFSSNGYKKGEYKLFDEPCITGTYFDGKIILLSHLNKYVLSAEGDIEQIQTLEICSLSTCYKVDVFNNKLRYFLLSEQFSLYEDQEIYIYASQYYIKQLEDIFVFFGDEELYITDFSECLCFELDKFINLEKIDNYLMLSGIVQNESFVSKITDWTPEFTTILDEPISNTICEKTNNGINIYVTSDQTYKYFVCNHGDIITKSVYSDKIILSINETFYKDNTTITFSSNGNLYTTPVEIFEASKFVGDIYVFFEAIGDDIFTNGIYFGKLK